VPKDIPDDHLFLNENDDLQSPPSSGQSGVSTSQVFFIWPYPDAAGNPDVGGVVLWRRCLWRFYFKTNLPPLPFLNAVIPAGVPDKVFSAVMDIGRDGGLEVERAVDLKFGAALSLSLLLPLIISSTLLT